MQAGPLASATPRRAFAGLLRVLSTFLLALLLVPASLGAQDETTLLPLGLGAESIRIIPTGRLYTVEDVAYSEGRTTIVYGDMTIAADVMVIDFVTEELNAEGNVVFQRGDDIVRGSAARFNLRRAEGVAWDGEGEYQGVFFRSIEGDDPAEGASLTVLNEDESVFRDATFTACGFPVPHYYVKCSEIVWILDERVFFRSATLVVRGVPVFYWPFLTRRLGEPSPWTFEFGWRSDYGAYTRIGYEYEYETLVPDWENPETYRERSRGRVGLHGDLFSAGVVGAGVNWQYKQDFERHIGELDLYGVRDRERKIEEGNEEEGFDNIADEDRWFYRHRHNSMLGKTIWQLNADWMSDPDVYYDFSDPFNDERGRLEERRVRAAMTYLERDWVARVSGEIKDRVTLKRYQDFTDIQDDDLNYDPDPDLAYTGRDYDGIDDSRYGRVSEKLEGRVATRMLPFLRTPLYWRQESNAFYNLDPGFNEDSERDDARIAGGDSYWSMTHRTRFDRNGRFTWLNTVGVGAGYYDRDTDKLVAGDANPANDGLMYLNGHTIYAADGKRKIDFEDYDPYFVWADYTSRLNARFNDSLSGYVKYSIREGNSDNLGQFYEDTGRQEAFEDIYNFPIQSHWVEAFLEYTLLYPNLDVYMGGGYNLQGGSDISANEKLWHVTAGGAWENDTGEWKVDGYTTLEGRQARDRDDPDEFRRAELRGVISTRYLPRHGRYWAGLEIGGDYPLDDDPAYDDPMVDNPRKRARFDEDESDLSIRPTIGRQLGPKYAVELVADYSTRIEDLKSAGVIVHRDLHDADLSFFGGFRSSTMDSRDEDDDTNRDYLDTDRELDFRVNLRFKQPREKAALSAASIQTMRDREREAVFVE